MPETLQGRPTITPVWSLTVLGRRVMCPVEELDQFSVANSPLLVGTLYALGVSRASGTDLSII